MRKFRFTIRYFICFRFRLRITNFCLLLFCLARWLRTFMWFRFLRPCIHEIKQAQLPCAARNLCFLFPLREDCISSFDILMDNGKCLHLLLIILKIQWQCGKSGIHLRRQPFRHFRIFQQGRQGLSGLLMKEIYLIRAPNLFWQSGIKPNDTVCHLHPFIHRHTGKIAGFQILIIVNQKLNTLRHLRPFQEDFRFWAAIVSPCQFQTFPVIIRIGMIRPGKRMAAPANPIPFLYKIRFFFIALILDKKSIGTEPPIRIRAAAR